MRINRFTPERGATQPQQHCGNSGWRANLDQNSNCSTCPPFSFLFFFLPLPPSLNSVVLSSPCRLISQVVDYHQEAKTKSSMSKQLAPLFTSQANCKMHLIQRERDRERERERERTWSQLGQLQKKNNSWSIGHSVCVMCVHLWEQSLCLNPSAFLPRSPSSAIWSWQLWHTHTHTFFCTHHWLQELTLSGDRGLDGQNGSRRDWSFAWG